MRLHENKTKKSEERISKNYSRDALRVFNPSSLFSLGQIDHFVIAKSGTLTTGETSIGGLATPIRMYEVQFSSLSSMKAEVERNPDQFIQKEDDSFEESDKYSEKS